ncbi:ATP synthase, H transporting, mitochondrial Fo complex, subunit s (factor B) [Chamberlinius hualienensis]
MFGLGTKHLFTASVFTQKNIALYNYSKRNFWGWLNTVFNKVDRSRIEAVGPDLACAEWLIRCGASVKWKGTEDWHKDYNTLPRGKSQLVIEEIDGTDSSIMHIGFEHLRDLKHLRKIRLNKCHYLDDPSIPKLLYVQSTLKELHITNCGNITQIGLMSLIDMQNLKYLELFDLPSVKDLDGCYQLLTKGLPHCEINYRVAKT